MFQDIIDILNKQKGVYTEVILQGNIDTLESLKYHRGILFGLDLALERVKDYQKEMDSIHNSED